MYRIYSLVVFFCLLFPSQALHAQFSHAQIRVSGLTCSLCSNATERSLRQLDWIDELEVDLNETLFSITFRPGSTINIDQLAEKVEGAGFSVSKLTVWYNFSQPVQVDESQKVQVDGHTFVLLDSTTQTLDGEVAFTFLDKHFIPIKDYKSRLKTASIESYRTGYEVLPAPAREKLRVFHVVL